MGKHGNSKLKNNGEYLVNILLNINKLIIDICFPCNLVHYTTCILPQRNGDANHHGSIIMQNSYLHQIYYIFVKKSQEYIITHSQPLNLKPTNNSLRWKCSWNWEKRLRKIQWMHKSIQKISMINSYGKNIRTKS